MMDDSESSYIILHVVGVRIYVMYVYECNIYISCTRVLQIKICTGLNSFIELIRFGQINLKCGILTE